MLTDDVKTLTDACCKFPDMEIDQLAKNAQMARTRAGFSSPNEAAEAIGCSRTLVIAWEKGDTRLKGSKYLLAAAEAYKVRPQWLAENEGDDGWPWPNGDTKPISNHDATADNALSNQLRRVRIEGAIAMDDKGFWGSTETETEVRFVEWAAGEGAYALEVASDALHQKYKRGSVLVFDKGNLEPGEPAHLELADGRQAILEFLYESSGRVYLQSLLGADRYSFGRDEIRSIHAYAGHVSARLIKS